jgi:lipopolysaccharide/colanic/teichoic acid biosynthesis glycosyltransferase
VKRTIDIVGAALLLVVCGPTLLVIALLIKLSSPGPAFFRQRRYGRDGRVFSILKFRTMIVDAEEVLRRDAGLQELLTRYHYKIPMKADPRITPIGRFLRLSSLDELPQLWNVLIGEMSFVGPRPITVEDGFTTEEHRAAYGRVRPGLTGVWQVSGRSNCSWDDRQAIDIAYATGWTLLLDFSVLLRTLPAVLTSRGADVNI